MSPTTAALLGAAIGAIAAVGGTIIAQWMAAKTARIAEARRILGEFVVKSGALVMLCTHYRHTPSEEREPEQVVAIFAAFDDCRREATLLRLHVRHSRREDISAALSALERLVDRTPQVEPDEHREIVRDAAEAFGRCVDRLEAVLGHRAWWEVRPAARARAAREARSR